MVTHKQAKVFQALYDVACVCVLCLGSPGEGVEGASGGRGPAASCQSSCTRRPGGSQAQGRPGLGCVVMDALSGALRIL